MAQNSAISGKLVNHRSVNYGPFKDDVSHLCPVGAVVASWSLTQEVTGLNSFTSMTNILVKLISEELQCFSYRILSGNRDKFCIE